MCKYRYAVVAALSAWMLFPSALTAFLTNADDLPRIQLSDLAYVGGFRLPAGTANGDDFSFGGQPIAFNPATNTLFVASYRGNVAEVNIPAPVNSGDVNAMPFASYVQSFADPTEGHLADISSGGVNLSGLMVYGDRLYGTATIFYDANNTQRASHFSRSLQLNQPSFSGWSSVWQADRSGFVSGWMAAVPSEWQASLGGPAVTGQCCVSIAWRTSTGPSAFAFNPSQIGQPSVPASPLLYYGLDHPTLGPWDGSNPTYGATTQIQGVALIAGSRTALFFGRNGLGPHCYGNGTPNKALEGTVGVDGANWCYDPTNSDKGSHAYPYRYQVWAYDLNDFAAVKAGTKQPWDLVPYEVWTLNLPTPEAMVRLGGVAYDAQRQLLYISQRGADADGYASRSVIHVIRVTAGTGAAPPAGTGVSRVSMTADKASPQPIGTSITLAAQPTDGTAPFQYKWLISDGSTSTVAAEWNASNRFTWTPSTGGANYRVTVWVRSAGNTADAFEASTSAAFTIAPVTTATPATAVTLVPNRVPPQPPLAPITWTATPSGGVAPHQYKWLVSDGMTTTVVANWSTTGSFAWTPSSANANYRVTVWVRSAGNATENQEASNSLAFPIADLATSTPTPTLPRAAISEVTLTSDKPSPQPASTSVLFTAQAVGGAGPFQYQWWVLDGGQWSAAGGWGSINTLRWSRHTPGSNYQIAVRARNAGSTNDQGEASATLSFVLTGGGQD